jgi:hypothetical protein
MQHQRAGRAEPRPGNADAPAPYFAPNFCPYVKEQHTAAESDINLAEENGYDTFYGRFFGDWKLKAPFNYEHVVEPPVLEGLIRL